MNATDYKPGKLVSFRGREWIVLPSADDDLIMMKPMGGSDEEITSVFIPLDIPGDNIDDDVRFPVPSSGDLDDFQSAKMLFDATRLSFRNASGPFRCMGKLSFRPRSYQVVPLVMALQQDTVRLLIADDVGIGKTIEALMILKEMMERGDIKRFAVICLPHLCEQWQQELKDKLDIHAEIIRGSTAASLDRKLPDDRSVFYHIPYQVISIDYIKSDRRRDFFLQDCPELVIVDEAHTCALPAGSTSASQQQRYHLLSKISKKAEQHMVLLTATPHSGKDKEFQSILGLLNKEFEDYNFDNLEQSKRRKIARFFIQRKRENIMRWHRKTGDEKTPFPTRDSKEVNYALSLPYQQFYKDVLRFARGISKDGAHIRSTTIRYWAALALLRGVMSSPATAVEMLNNREQRKLEDDERKILQERPNPLFETYNDESDTSNVDLINNAELSANELNEIGQLREAAQLLYGPKEDWKAQKAIEIIKTWLKEGHNPIVFCKYIHTANYFGKLLKEALPAKIDVKIVTSDDPDEKRRETISFMADSDQRVMVATDCLSEGINLQDLFTAVLHYDLPWNPNRIDQREGRVDRFGQESEVVKTMLLIGQDNEIDQKVFEILVKKVRQIGTAIGIDEQASSIFEMLARSVIEEQPEDKAIQLQMFEKAFTNELENARKKAMNLRNIFAHDSIDPEFINKNLDEIDEAIGDLHSVEEFVKAAVTHLGGSVLESGPGYTLNLTNLPDHLRTHFPLNKPVKVSFESPTPSGFSYLGRNHLFVEQLCQYMLSLAFEHHPDYKKVARASVIQTDSVDQKTTLIQFRVRNVIKEVTSNREVISEEIYLWGYEGSGADGRELKYEEAKNLLLQATSKKALTLQMQQEVFDNEIAIFTRKAEDFKKVAEMRAVHLVEAHGRFKELVGGKRYEAVYPVLPPDIMGVYVLNPVPKDLF